MPPDPVLVTVAVLRDLLPSAVTAGTVVPPDLTAKLPFVHVAAVRGRIVSPSWRGGPVVESATVALSCWAGPDAGHARALAREVLSALLPVRSVAVDGGTVVAVLHVSSPVHVPDPFAPADCHRYVTTVAVTVH
ncbi:hypothetical protein [Stackebrandtia soli]|uniref:hypothetical protein n=1 Tax=Stackebrandtia soli TaxID=1892856 RepID=UPI0039E92B92